MSIDHRGIAQLAASQQGVVSHRQLVELGTAARTIHRLETSGRIEPIGPNAYAIAGTVPTWRRTAHAGTLACGEQALCSHRAAISLWFPRRRDPSDIDVLIPRGGYRPSGPWSIHETTQLDAVDRALIAGIPVTSIDRTLIDIGAFWRPEWVGSALDDAIAEGHTSLESFSARVASLAKRGRRGIGVARAVLEDRGVNPGTPIEREMYRILCGLSAPKPVREYEVIVGTQRYFVDFAYPEALLGIECDSSTWHTKPHHFEYDLRRQNDIVGTGMLLLRYTTTSIRTEAGRIARDVERHLRARHPAVRSPIP